MLYSVYENTYFMTYFKIYNFKICQIDACVQRHTSINMVRMRKSSEE
jgi:hypothetical protein